ncbi:MAG TPA: hypothetical protein DFS52_17760, partial [Myxococcales bacterium]|nr:hypothetical protein [Myxococcales bacterium]
MARSALGCLSAFGEPGGRPTAEAWALCLAEAVDFSFEQSKIESAMRPALLMGLLLLGLLGFALVALREHKSRRALASAACPKCGALLGSVPRLVRVFVNPVSDHPDKTERYQLHCPHCSSL